MIKLEDLIEDTKAAGLSDENGLVTPIDGQPFLEALAKFAELTIERQLSNGEAVGTSMISPIDENYTVATFNADRVPAGTKLFTAPQQSRIPSESEPVLALRLEINEILDNGEVLPPKTRESIYRIKNLSGEILAGEPIAEVTKHGIFGIDRNHVFNVGDKLYAAPSAPIEAQQSVAQALAWKERIDWLLSHDAKDADGYEYGIMRAKFNEDGILDHAMWCLNDGSDIDKAMREALIPSTQAPERV